MNELIRGTQTMPGTLILLLKTVEGARGRVTRLEKVRSLRGCRHGADIVPAREAIAIGGDESVGGFANRTGKEAKQGGQHSPGLRQGAQAGEDGVGADEQIFDGRAHLAQNQYGVCGALDSGAAQFAGIAGGGIAVACQDFGDDGVAGGRKAQAVAVVPLQKPANGAVAESALAVEDDQEAVL